MTGWRRAVDTARWGLRAYGGSALLIIVAGAAALAMALPVLSLGGAGHSRLRLAPLPDADLGIVLSSLAVSATALQRHAVTTLGELLVGLGVAVLAVALMAMLGLASARGFARRSEVRVRRAVGASRRQLLAGGLVEGSVIAVVALGLGVSLGAATAAGAIAAWPGTVAAGSMLVTISAMLGVAAAALLGAATPMVSMRRVARAAPRAALPHGLTVPAVQLGISLAILVGAAQLARQGRRLVEAPPSLRGDGEIFQVSLAAERAERATRYASLVGRLRADTRVNLVSLTSPGALAGLGTADLVITDCGRCSQGGIATPLRAVPATLSAVSTDTFGATGARLVSGRGLADTDTWGAEPVAVVNRALAAGHFAAGAAVGRQLRVGRGPEDRWYRVVGVVEDAPATGFGGAFEPRYAVYLSALQLPPRAFDLLVRPRGADPVVAAVEGALAASLGPAGTLVGRLGESDRRAADAAPVRWFAGLVQLEGFVALAIAALGTFTVLQLWVRALTPELALRRAVGARRRHVLGYVMARALGVAGGGTAVGLWVGEIAADPLTSMFAGLPGRDVGLVARPALILATAALVGAAIPAWRAAGAAPAAAVASLED